MNELRATAPTQRENSGGIPLCSGARVVPMEELTKRAVAYWSEDSAYLSSSTRDKRARADRLQSVCAVIGIIGFLLVVAGAVISFTGTCSVGIVTALLGPVEAFPLKLIYPVYRDAVVAAEEADRTMHLGVAHMRSISLALDATQKIQGTAVRDHALLDVVTAALREGGRRA